MDDPISLRKKFYWINILSDKYYNLKIFYKLILNNLLLLGVVFSISLLSLQITLKIYDEQLYLKSVQVLNFFITGTENDFKSIERFSFNIALDPDIQDQLAVIKNSLPKYDRFKEITTLKDKLLLQSLSEKNLSGVTFIDTLGYEYTVGKNPPPPVTSIKNELISKAKANKGGNVFVEPTQSFEFLTSAREILQFKNVSLDPLGTLIFYCNIKDIVNQNFNALQNDKTQLHIYSGHRLIYANTGGIGAIDPNLCTNEKQGYFIINIKVKKNFVSYVTSDFMKWTYVSLLPYDNFYSKNIKLRNILILSFIVLFFITIYISYKTARNITKPIEDLTSSMKQVENGDFQNVETDLSDHKRTDEVGCLQKDFVIMINRINELIKENYEKQLFIKDTEYKALQAQINPHFLYNTLSSINWLIETGKNEGASQMIMSLSSLLRASDSKKPVICIDEEVELLKSYVDIQKIRYEDRAEFIIDIKDQHKQYLIPRMTLQPLVENCINYGVENMRDLCTITVSSKENESDLEIYIEDNGPGIEKDFLEKIRKFEITPKSTGIGLKNINDRLKLLFGEESGIQINSEVGKGTTIIIKLPKR